MTGKAKKPENAAPRPPLPAATVIVMQDGVDGLEVLLVQRDRSLSFHGGAWVFPGGKLDPGDRTAEEEGDELLSFRRAAVREVFEETGLILKSKKLIPFSHWITPEILPQRFDTWFFAARSQNGSVTVDGGEIRSHRWLKPDDALQEQRTRSMVLPPPVFVTLEGLRGCSSTDEALSEVRIFPPLNYFPRIREMEGGSCFLYAEDVAYRDFDLERPGPRHRLWALDKGWRYESTLNAKGRFL